MYDSILAYKLPWGQAAHIVRLAIRITGDDDQNITFDLLSIDPDQVSVLDSFASSQSQFVSFIKLGQMIDLNGTRITLDAFYKIRKARVG